MWTGSKEEVGNGKTVKRGRIWEKRPFCWPVTAQGELLVVGQGLQSSEGKKLCNITCKKVHQVIKQTRRLFQEGDSI